MIYCAQIGRLDEDSELWVPICNVVLWSRENGGTSHNCMSTSKSPSFFSGYQNVAVSFVRYGELWNIISCGWPSLPRPVWASGMWRVMRRRITHAPVPHDNRQTVWLSSLTSWPLYMYSSAMTVVTAVMRKRSCMSSDTSGDCINQSFHGCIANSIWNNAFQ